MITDPLSLISKISKSLERIDDRLTTIEKKVSKQATKDDLKLMVMKSDIRNMVTKNDLKNFATKDDLRYTMDNFREDMNLDIEEKLTKFRNHIMNGISTVIGELKIIREEQSAHQLQHETLNDIPDRVEKLEKLYSQHQ